jgi:hypothetical protein
VGAVTGSRRQHRLLSLLRGSKGRQLAILLVGAILLCHGVLGVLHLCSTSTVPVHQTHEHPSFTDETAAGHDHPVCHLTGTEYFAVLYTAFLGLLFGLLLKGARLWGRVASFRPSKPYLPPLVAHPPRGPTNLPVLQVFRL